MRGRFSEGTEVFGGRGDVRRSGQFSEEGDVFGTGGGFRRTGSFFFFFEKGCIFVGRGISEEGEVFGGGVAFSEEKVFR